MKKFYLLFILIIIFCKLISQTTYFVSSSMGNDNNSGTQGSQPWATIGKVNQLTLGPNDKVMFRRGDIWVGEQLNIHNFPGTDPNPITFGAYPQNNDPRPIISTIVNHQHTWTNVSGNIWKAINPPAYHPERILVDGTELLRANILTELDGINFFWLYDANGDLYIYSATNPSSKQISYTNGNFAISVENSTGIVITNIEMQGGWANAKVGSSCEYIHFVNVKSGKYAKNGIYLNTNDLSSAATTKRVHIKLSDFDSDFNFDYSMANDYSDSYDRGVANAIHIERVQHCEIDSNVFNNWGNSSIYIKGSTNIQPSNISIHHNYFTNNLAYGAALVFTNVVNSKVFYNEIINTSAPNTFNGSNLHIHHNIIDGIRNSKFISSNNTAGVGIVINSTSYADVANNTIEHNLIKNTYGYGYFIYPNGNVNIISNNFRNNIVYLCGQGDAFNNVGINILNDSFTSQTSQNTFQNNLVYNNQTTQTIKFRGGIMDITDFNDLDGTSSYTISDNIAGDPLFVDVSSGDYHLTQSSPCVNAGTTPTAEIDFEGNDIPFPGTLPDIGIFESSFISTDIKINEHKTISFYPNPANNKVTIKTDSKIILVELFDVFGKKVYEGNNNEISLISLKKGIYIIQIVDEFNHYKNRLVINK